jgi:hypothetical protein
MFTRSGRHVRQQFVPFVGAAVLAIAGAGTIPVSAADADPALAKACAAVRSSGGLPTCTELHPGRRAIRLPEGTSERPYGVLARGGGVVTAQGRRLPLTQRVAGSFTNPRAYATRVYRATVADDKVTELDARMRVPARLVMDRVFGSRMLVGRISRRTGRQGGSASFSTTPTLPLIIRLKRASRTGVIRGSILNATAAVAAAGVCYRSLAANGKANPLVGGFSSRITVERFPGMHAPFADQQVLGWENGSSGMGSAFYPSLATLMGRDPLGRAWRVGQHGNPTTGPALRLRFAARSAETTRC